MSKFFEIIFTLFALSFVVSQVNTWKFHESPSNIEVVKKEAVSEEVFPEEETDEDYEEEICPINAKDFCYVARLGKFTGEVHCDKPIMCGETPMEAPKGTECEWDPENPNVATKVCIEGECVSFIRTRGDC